MPFDPDDVLLDVLTDLPVTVQAPGDVAELPSAVVVSITPTGTPMAPLLGETVVYDVDCYATRTASTQTPPRRVASNLARQVRERLYTASRDGSVHAGAMVSGFGCVGPGEIRSGLDNTYRFTATYTLLLMAAGS